MHRVRYSSTKVYSYDGWLSHRCATTTATTGGGGGRRRHPFAEPPKSSSSSRGARDDNNDDDSLFLTQGDNDYDGDDGDAGGANCTTDQGQTPVAYSPLPALSDNDDDDDDKEIVLLASMGMDGRVVIWDVSSSDAQLMELDWDVITETTRRTAGTRGSTSGTSTSRAVRATPSR